METNTISAPEQVTQVKSFAPINNIEDYLNLKYEMRRNVVTNKPEIRKKTLNGEEADFIEIGDYKFHSLYRELTNYGFRCTEAKLRSILSSDFCPEFDPFEEYFKGLPEWNPETDSIGELTKTVQTTNDEFWEVSLMKWLVAVVACLLDPSATNDHAIVLSGKQGIGKTRWCTRLVPNKLQKYQYSGTIKPDNKDTHIHLAECMLINLDELENLQRKELGTLKEIITKPYIRIRRPYAVYAEKLPRRASFIGSVNESEFLADPTGSRRFLCFTVEKLKYQHEIDMDKVYAQAYALYKEGFQYYFKEAEIDEILRNNKSFESSRAEEEMLLKYFIPADEDSADNFMTTTDILEDLTLRTLGRIRLSPKIFGSILRKHFIRMKKDGRYVYPVKYRDINVATKEQS